MQYATCSLLHARVSPAVTAAGSSCNPRAKRASASMPQSVAAVIQASKSLPRRSRTRVRKPWVSPCACAIPASIWQSWSRYVCASADRLAAGPTMTNETARPDGPWGRMYDERCDSGGCPASAARPGGWRDEVWKALCEDPTPAGPIAAEEFPHGQLDTDGPRTPGKVRQAALIAAMH